jgi:hypothetical protein
MNINEKFINAVSKIVYSILKKENILIGQWHLGKVESVISAKKISVYVDGSTTPQEIPCNPDITFSVNDEIWVIFINNDSRNKFAISKRAV